MCPFLWFLQSVILYSVILKTRETVKLFLSWAIEFNRMICLNREFAFWNLKLGRYYWNSDLNQATTCFNSLRASKGPRVCVWIYSKFIRSDRLQVVSLKTITSPGEVSQLPLSSRVVGCVERKLQERVKACPFPSLRPVNVHSGFSLRSAQGEPIWGPLLWCGAAILIQEHWEALLCYTGGSEVNWLLPQQCGQLPHSIGICDSKSNASLWRQAEVALVENIIGRRSLKVEWALPSFFT